MRLTLPDQFGERRVTRLDSASRRGTSRRIFYPAPPEVIVYPALVVRSVELWATCSRVIGQNPVFERLVRRKTLGKRDGNRRLCLLDCLVDRAAGLFYGPLAGPPTSKPRHAGRRPPAVGCALNTTVAPRTALRPAPTQPIPNPPPNCGYPKMTTPNSRRRGRDH